MWPPAAVFGLTFSSRKQLSLGVGALAMGTNFTVIVLAVLDLLQEKLS